MADLGHELTDEMLKELEKDIRAEYAIAVKDMQGKLEAYLEKTEAQRKIQEELLNKGAITQQEYRDWCYRHAMVGKRWQEMRDVLAEDMHLQRMLSEFADDILRAENLVVVKCQPGTAPGVAAAVDCADLANVLGSVAGNDTVLIIVDTTANAIELQSLIEKLGGPK